VFLNLPLGDYQAVFYDDRTGAYVDHPFKVTGKIDPADTYETGGAAVLRPNVPDWSFEPTNPTKKQYGATQIDLDIEHSNAGSNQAKAIAEVKWFRESVGSPVDRKRPFDVGYDVAATGDRGIGAASELLNLAEDVSDSDSQHFTMNAEQNGRYWLQIHYKGANTGLDVFHVTHVDVTNIYTPVAVNVREAVPEDGTYHDAYEPLTSRTLGVPFDLDGTVLSNPPLGYDRVTYVRDKHFPASQWQMDVPWDQPAQTPVDAMSSEITLDSTVEDKAEVTAASSATNLFFTVNYSDRARAFTLTFDPNGGVGDPYVVNQGGTGVGTIVVPTLEDTGIVPADGMAFVGWNSQPNGKGVQYVPGSTVSGLGVRTLYAQWSPILTTLTVKKTASGPLADMTRAFDFTIRLTDANGVPLSGSYSGTGAGGQFTIMDGIGTFKLVPGQSVTISGVPMAARVQVIETPVIGYAGSFADSVQPGIVFNGSDTSLLKMSLDRELTFMSTSEAPPDTQVRSSDAALAFLLPAVIVIGAAVLFMAKWKRKGCQ